MSVFGSDDEIHPLGGVSEDYVNAQDALRVLKAGDTMKGTLQMSGNLIHGLPTSYPPLYKGDEAASWAQVTGIVKDTTTNAATKNYVDTQDSLRVLKSGDTMTGELDMGANWVTGVANPTDSQDAATKAYVDTTRVKPLITIWVEGRGRIEHFDYKFLFGDGFEGHNRSGYPMVAAGRVLRMGLMAITREGSNAGKTTVCIVVNGLPHRDYKIAKPVREHSAVTIFARPFELGLGSVINFMATQTDTSAVATVVSALIELDLE